MSDAQRKYATVKHPTIEALVHGLYKYVDRKQALSRFQNIRDNFVLRKEQPESTPDAPAVIFWIKGFAVTPEEEAQGFTGHFCRMELGTTDKGQHTLVATKIDAPITQHPQKKRLQSKHPNWGHPVMRAVKKGKIYPTLEAANAELELLHLEFPDVSIPGVNKLFLIIYEKREGVKQPTRKIALELAAKDGGFAILCKDNEKKTAKPASIHAPGTKPEGGAEAPKKIGAFTANELLRQKKRAAKRKSSDPRVSKRTGDTPTGN